MRVLLVAVLLLLLLLVLLGEAGLAASSSKKKKHSSSSSACTEDFFHAYHSSKEIFAFTEACAAQYPGMARITDIGKSAENVHLRIITLGHGPNHLFLMAGMHGREWITPASTLWTVFHLLSAGGTATPSEQDQERSALLASFTIHVLPLLNPDGLDFSRTTNSEDSGNQDRRQWRKNRRYLPCKGERCAHGVDLNRNWGVPGVTFGFGAKRPTSDVFQGKTPFSEPELKAVRKWLLGLLPQKMAFVLDVHCCAQTILPPSYYHGESEELKAQHLLVAKHVAQAMSSSSSSQEITYKFREREKEFSATNSGISVDWLYGEAGAGLALIVETRGNDKSKKLDSIFDVDTKFIIPIGRELLAAVYAVSKETQFLQAPPPVAVVTALPTLPVTTAPPPVVAVIPATPPPPQVVVVQEVKKQELLQEESANNNDELPPPPPPPPPPASEEEEGEEDEDGGDEPPPPPPPPEEEEEEANDSGNDDDEEVGLEQRDHHASALSQDERIDRLNDQIQEILSDNDGEQEDNGDDEGEEEAAHHHRASRQDKASRRMHVHDDELVIVDDHHADDDEEDDEDDDAGSSVEAALAAQQDALLQEQLRLRMSELRQANHRFNVGGDQQQMLTWRESFQQRVDRGKWKLPLAVFVCAAGVWAAVNRHRVLVWLRRPARQSRYED